MWPEGALLSGELCFLTKISSNSCNNSTRGTVARSLYLFVSLLRLSLQLYLRKPSQSSGTEVSRTIQLYRIYILYRSETRRAIFYCYKLTTFMEENWRKFTFVVATWKEILYSYRVYI